MSNPSYRKVWIVLTKDSGELQEGWESVEINLVTFNEKKAREIKDLYDKARSWKNVSEQEKSCRILRDKYGIGYWRGLEIEIDEYEVED